MFVALSPSTSAIRINRYIVGCKFSRHYKQLLRLYGINRYIVGCKYDIGTSQTPFPIELIDT